MSRGCYFDQDRSYDLPEHWVAADELDPDLLGTCLDRALLAVGGGRYSSQAAETALLGYFNPDSDYAGALFNTIPDGESNDVGDRIVAADLLAVTTLSMKLSARLVRDVLEDTDKRKRIRLTLSQIPSNRPISELSSGEDPPGIGSPGCGQPQATPISVKVLTAMEDLQSELRRIPKPSSNKWVFAAKLSARKRPELFPVRDNVVCKYLAGTQKLRRGHIGSFRVDVQVFAFVMSDPGIRSALRSHRDLLRSTYGQRIDSVPDLRLLDSALWMAGMAAGYDR